MHFMHICVQEHYVRIIDIYVSRDTHFCGPVHKCIDLYVQLCRTFVYVHTNIHNRNIASQKNAFLFLRVGRCDLRLSRKTDAALYLAYFFYLCLA